jgi:hypothetical protein
VGLSSATGQLHINVYSPAWCAVSCRKALLRFAGEVTLRSTPGATAGSPLRPLADCTSKNTPRSRVQPPIVIRLNSAVLSLHHRSETTLIIHLIEKSSEI